MEKHRAFSRIFFLLRICREAVLDLENGTGLAKDELIDLIGIDEDGYYDELFVDY